MSTTTQTTEELLAQRATTHGEYSEHARCTQAIMRALEAERNWSGLPDIVRETCHMIAHKLGRVVTGHALVQDHFDDISGYARLVSQRIVSEATTRPGVLAPGHRPEDLWSPAGPDPFAAPTVDVWTLVAEKFELPRHVVKLAVYKALDGLSDDSCACACGGALDASENAPEPPTPAQLDAVLESVAVRPEASEAGLYRALPTGSVVTYAGSYGQFMGRQGIVRDYAIIRDDDRGTSWEEYRVDWQGMDHHDYWHRAGDLRLKSVPSDGRSVKEDIRDRLVPRQEPERPGTPADGGQHSRGGFDG